MASTGFSQASVRGNALRAGGLVGIPRQHCRLHCPARLRSECTTGSRGALEDCTRSCRREFMPKAKCKPSINPPFDQPVKSALVFSAFSIPRINALRGYVVENKSRPIFPSWTSPVRPRSPAPTFQQLGVSQNKACSKVLQNTSQGSHPRIRHSGHFVSHVIDSIAEALSKFVE